MPTETDILTLQQWLSPAFPVGSFAYSHGLETAVQDGRITNAADLEAWLAPLVEVGSGRNDCILLRAAHAADGDAALRRINQTAEAFVSSAERLMETRLQGEAFTSTATQIWGGTSPDLVYPVAVGAAASRMGFDVSLTASMYLHAFASNLVSAAVRLVPLGQTEGQAVLAALGPLCQRVAQETEDRTLDDMQSTAFMADIAAMSHETLSHRIFRS